MNIIFMGTPDFAVPTLEAIIKAGHNVISVFSQPDKPKGRGYKLNPPPIKVKALEHGLTVIQPDSLRKNADDIINEMKQQNPDVIVVVAYGQILPKAVLEIPRLGCVNVHASLLPKYRGAGPIQWSVLNGEEQTGVTTMLMAEGLDTGDMLLKAATKIGENETASELHDRLSLIGAELLINTLNQLEKGEIVPQKQDDSLSSYAPMLSKAMSPINFEKSALEVHHQICGLSDWPTAVCEYEGKKIKVYRSAIVDKDCEHSYASGEIVDDKEFVVACKRGLIRFVEIQQEGGKRLEVKTFLRGKSIQKGLVLKGHT